MVSQPEDGWTVLGCIRPDALVDTPPVMQAGSQHMDLRLVPRDELAVHPDGVRGCEFHCRAPELDVTAIREEISVAGFPTTASWRSMLCDWSSSTSRYVSACAPVNANQPHRCRSSHPRVTLAS